MKLLVLEKREFDEWISKLEYVERINPKGYGSAIYLKCSEAGYTFPKNVEFVNINEDINGSELIEIITGNQSYTFTKKDIIRQIKKTESCQKFDLNELFELAMAKRDNYPTISLAYPIYSRYRSVENLLLDKSIKFQNISNGDLILIRRKTIGQLISDCETEIFRRGIQLSIVTLRNGGDFLQNLGYIKKKKIVRLNKYDSNSPQEKRPKVALLYTDEDINIASYIRNHFDSLDKASGGDCDVLFIEKPRAIDSSSFWKEILDEISYVVWKSLGWERSKPYNKAEIYDVVKTLKIPMDILPCAIMFKSEKVKKMSIVKLEGDLTSIFRGIFSHYQSDLNENKYLQYVGNMGSQSSGILRENENAKNAVCFLSHNYKDKGIVRKVAASLHTFGIDTWFDEWEILPGDSIVGKIEEGLRRATHIVIFLSKAAISSHWVSEEINTSLYHAISSKDLPIIPVLIEECDIPIILSSYAIIKDTSPGKIASSIQRTVLGITGKPPVRNRE